MERPHVVRLAIKYGLAHMCAQGHCVGIPIAVTGTIPATTAAAVADGGIAILVAGKDVRIHAYVCDGGALQGLASRLTLGYDAVLAVA